MQLWNVGDRSQAICRVCHARRSTTFAVRDVPLENEGITVPDVLVAVCDVCGGIAGIPAQSTPLLKEGLEREPAKLSTRITRKLEDAMRLIAYEYGTREREFRPMLVRYYLFKLSNNEEFAKRVAKLAKSEFVKGPKTSRLEIRLTEKALEAAWEAAKSAGLRTQSEMVSGVIAAATEDVLEHRAPKRSAELQQIAALA